MTWYMIWNKFNCCHKIPLNMLHVLYTRHSLCSYWKVWKTLNCLPLCNASINALFQNYFFSNVRHAGSKIVELKLSQRRRNTILRTLFLLSSARSAISVTLEGNTQCYESSSMNLRFWLQNIKHIFRYRSGFHPFRSNVHNTKSQLRSRTLKGFCPRCLQHFVRRGVHVVICNLSKNDQRREAGTVYQQAYA